ncbi:MAG: divalent-cation tolerance protein CutA [Planctomycetota bacterium]
MLSEQLISITTTFSTSAAAEACGRRLVEMRLAGCVQVEGPLTSMYRWQGRLETATEWRCVCKTVADREMDCIAAIMALHDYEIPLIAVVAVRGSPAYAAWIRDSLVEP